MIASSRIVAVGAVAVAFGLHAAGMLVRPVPDAVEIAGGAPGTAAALGQSFADMVAGTAAPLRPDTMEPQETDAAAATPEQPLPNTPAVLPQEVTAARPADRQAPEAGEAAAAVPPRTTAGAAVAVQGASVRRAAAAAAPVLPAVPPAKVASLPAARPGPEREAPLEPMASEAVRTSATQSPASPLDAIRPVAGGKPTSATEPRRLAALPLDADLAAAFPQHTERPTTPTRTPRPAVRPEALATEEPVPAERAQTRTQPPASAGNSDRNALQGSAAGSARNRDAARTEVSEDEGTAGTAALSNYKGQVFRKIARAQPQSVNIRGAALVSLTIGGSGQLASVRLARSSGSARLDQIALAQVRRAAPFPPTPDGRAQTFSVRIRGGG